MRLVAAALAILVLGVVEPLFARAEPPAAPPDDAQKVAILEKQFAKDLAAHQDDSVRDDLKQAKTLASTLKDPGLADRCTVAVGKVMKATPHYDLLIDVLKTLGEIRRAAAGPYVAPYLAQPTPEAQTPLVPVALEVAAKIHSDDLVDPLIKLFRESRVLAYAVGAVQTLGQFGGSAAKRVDVLDALLRDATQNPAGWGPVALRARTAALQDAVRDAANSLTGRTLATLAEWVRLYQAHRNDLSTLFPPLPK